MRIEDALRRARKISIRDDARAGLAAGRSISSKALGTGHPKVWLFLESIYEAGMGHVGGETDEFRRTMHPDDRYLLAQYHALANSQDLFRPSTAFRRRMVRFVGCQVTGGLSDRNRMVAPALINVATDITERKTAELHQRFLLGELSHRSKNLLTIVQAIADQTLRGAIDLNEFKNRFDSRLQGLAASNDLLARGDWQGTSLTRLSNFSSPRLSIYQVHK